MPSTPEALAGKAIDRLLELEGTERKLIAVAGPPGAGKSTITALIRDGLEQRGRRAAVIPMDGFHLDNRLLVARGLLPRKGAMATFDAGGFRHLVARIAAGEEDVVYPVFDRSRDIAIAGAEVLAPDVEFLLFEGNYLLIRQPPWTALAAFWNFTIRIDAHRDVLEARLMDRWRAEGLSEEAAARKVQDNDLPNVDVVRAESAESDLLLHENA